MDSKTPQLEAIDQIGEVIEQLFVAIKAEDEPRVKEGMVELADVMARAEGNVPFVEEMRAFAATLGQRPPARKLDDGGQPDAEIPELVDCGHREERLAEIHMSPTARSRLEQVVAARVGDHAGATLEPARRNQNRITDARGLADALFECRRGAPAREVDSDPSKRKLLFHGPHGCGKKLAVAAVAGELGLPLFLFRLNTVANQLSRGVKTDHLERLFDVMMRRRAVYLLDDFDTIVLRRGLRQAYARPMLESLTKLIDADESESVIVAAMEYPEHLDEAESSCFQVKVAFDPPDEDELKRLLESSMPCLAELPPELPNFEQLAGVSYAEVLEFSGVMDSARKSLLTSWYLERAVNYVVKARELASRASGGSVDELRGQLGSRTEIEKLLEAMESAGEAIKKQQSREEP